MAGTEKEIGYVKRFDMIEAIENQPIKRMPEYLEIAFNKTDDRSHDYLTNRLAEVMQARRNKLMKEGKPHPSGAMLEMHDALTRSLAEDEQPSFKTVAEALDTFGYRLAIAPRNGDYLKGSPTLNGAINTKAKGQPELSGALNTTATRKSKKQKTNNSAEI